MKDEFLTTAEAARMAGVGVSSIKRWADQQLIRVTRTPGGHRRVQRADLIRFLQESRNDAVRPGDETHIPGGDGEAARPGASTGRRSLPVGRQSLPSVGSPDPSFYSHTEDPPSDAPNTAGRVGASWANAILTTDIFELQGHLLQARGRLGSWHAVADEAIEGVIEIGRRWRQGKVTILEEHIASENLSRALGGLAETLPKVPEPRVCLLACPPGEAHTLGLSFLQLCLREAGWQVLWVGGSTPEDELCRVAETGDLDMIALSASTAYPDQARLAELAARLEEACERSGTRLVLGGEGGWPDDFLYAVRFRAFGPFSQYVNAVA